MARTKTRKSRKQSKYQLTFKDGKRVKGWFANLLPGQQVVTHPKRTSVESYGFIDRLEANGYLYLQPTHVPERKGCNYLFLTNKFREEFKQLELLEEAKETAAASEAFNEKSKESSVRLTVKG